MSHNLCDFAKPVNCFEFSHGLRMDFARTKGALIQCIGPFFDNLGKQLAFTPGLTDIKPNLILE